MTDIQQVIQQANKKMDTFLVLETQYEEQKKAGKGYENRDRIPEPLLAYADLYHELTKQKPTLRAVSDWIKAFEEWKEEELEREDIIAAWNQARGERGFMVGRPGALTITAIAAKSKANSAPALEVNRSAIEGAKARMAEKWDTEAFVPRPASVERPKLQLHKKPLYKKGMEPK